MKKSIFTLFSLMAVVLFITPNLLLAQQDNSADDEKVVIVTKIVDDEGNVTIERKTLSKGATLEHNLEQLNLEGIEGKDVELKVYGSTHGDVHVKKGSGNDETVFLFRQAQELNQELEELNEELKSLRITMGDDIKWNKKCDVKALKSCNKALLGIYPESHEQGVLVTGIVKGSGAEAAGLQKGDIITALNGKDVDSNRDLTEILAQHKPGETISVSYLRNGNPAQTNATLTEKKQKRYSYNYNYDYNYNYSYRHNNYRDFSNRNKCKPFIGVYTSRTSKGMKISSVLKGTSAERAYLQQGDIITALDGVPTRSHSELVRERDKHEPGDYYTLTIISAGSTIDIEAQFDECPKDEPVVEEEILTEETPEVQPEIQPEIDNTLQLESFDAFPNPTYGAVNIRFQGSAVPTKVRIIDVTGKTVFQDDIGNFDGIYNRDLNLENATPGALIVNIQQGNKMFSKSLILLPRA